MGWGWSWCSRCTNWLCWLTLAHLVSHLVVVSIAVWTVMSMSVSMVWVVVVMPPITMSTGQLVVVVTTVELIVVE